MNSQLQIHSSKLFSLIQLGEWEEITSYLLESFEGREEVITFGIDLLYIAVEYRAPASIIIVIFDLLEREKGRQMKLSPTLLLKALYLSPDRRPNICLDQCSRNWENNERINVANFLSDKIST